MKEELEVIERQVQVLLALKFEGMSLAQQQQLRDSVSEIQNSYLDAVDRRDDKQADEATKKYYAGVCDSVAKGLPNITKGALSAAGAFEKGDYINGTAALMDICASAAPIIGSLFAAGGPPGALIGALFSVVGQLLAYFGPKQPSLKDEIKNIMLGLEQEAMLRTMSAVGDSIDVYADKLEAASVRLAEILKRPLQTEAQADDFYRDCKALEIGLARGQASMDVPAFNNWEVMEWLRTKDRQDLAKWPEVLGVFCRSYTKLVNANVLFACLPDGNKIYSLLKQTSESNPDSPLLVNTRHDIHKLLLKVQSMAIAFSADWKFYNKRVLELMGNIERAAQFRGLFFHVGGKGYLYAGSGRKALVDDNGWTYLSAGPDQNLSGYGYIDRLTVTLSWADEALDSPNPTYHCFLQRNGGSSRSTEHRRVEASHPPQNRDSRALSTWFNTPSKPVVADLSAVPGGWPDKPKEVWLYFASGSKISEVELNEKNELENRGWESQDAKSPLTSVRSVYPDSVRDDPDGDLTGVLPSITPKVHTLIHYGGMANSPDIFVVAHHESIHEYVPTPWTNYVGIGVDHRFLWVFGTGGFACASHASVLRAVNERRKGNKTSKPRWITHYPNQLLYKGLPVGKELVGPRKDEPLLRGLCDLAPCDDGTLTTAVYTRSYDGNGKLQGEDGPHIYAASYEVDAKAGTIQLGEWTKLHGEAQRVLKQPIFCWPMLERLKMRLVAEGLQG